MILPGIGVFGTGSVVRILVPLLRSKGFKVEAIWSQTLDLARQLSKDLNVAFYTDRVDDLLLHKDVDLVVIVCPPNLHAQIAVKALGIGKHVVCDRPAGICQSEVLKMVHAAQYYPSLISIVGHGLRFLPAFVQMRKCVSDGYVGEVTVCDVRVQCGNVISCDEYDWTCDDTMGGGVLSAVGSHCIDIVGHVTGQRAIRVHGLLRTFRKTTDKIRGIRQITSDDFCTFQMEMSRGALVTVTLNNSLPGQFVQEVLVCGSKGNLVVRGGDLHGQKLEAHKPGTGLHKEEVIYLDVEDLNTQHNIASDLMHTNSTANTQMTTTTTTSTSSHNHHVCQLPKPYMKGLVKMVGALREAFAPVEDKRSWVKEPVALAATFEDGQYIQAVIDAVRKSSRTRDWVRVKLQVEETDPNPFLSAAVRRSIIST